MPRARHAGLVVLLLWGWGCTFDTSGVAPATPTDDGNTLVDGWFSDGTGVDGLRADGPLPDGRLPDGPLPDGLPDGSLPDGPSPDGLTPDLPPVCPASCAIGCLPGTATCPLPSNVGTGQLPSPCGSLTLGAATTWRVCSDGVQPNCRIVSGTNCNASAACSGKAMTQTATIGGASVVACVFVLDALDIASSATLQVRGASPAILVVKGTARVAGKINASASGRLGGAGGGDGGETASNGKGASGTGPVPTAGGHTCDCQTSEDNYDDCGGGGGGFATVGGGGGLEGGKFCTAGPQPLGGITYGNAQLAPLVGGSGGGSGDVGNNAGAMPGNGGGGGGAVQISALTLELTGAVLANGGPGKGGYSWNSTYPGGGGGAGSGGAILLEAATFVTGGWTLAAGGGGGGGGDDCTAGDGKQDTLSGGVEQPPTGGPNCNSGGDGGDGAYGPAPPSAAQKGENAGIWEGPGGGGGGAGYIRFNRVGGLPACPPAGISTSGVVSCGAMQQS